MTTRLQKIAENLVRWSEHAWLNGKDRDARLELIAASMNNALLDELTALADVYDSYQDLQAARQHTIIALFARIRELKGEDDGLRSPDFSTHSSN